MAFPVLTQRPQDGRAHALLYRTTTQEVDTHSMGLPGNPRSCAKPVGRSRDSAFDEEWAINRAATVMFVAMRSNSESFAQLVLRC